MVIEIFCNSFTLWDSLGCEAATAFTITTKGKLELSADTIPIFGSGISIQVYSSVPLFICKTAISMLQLLNADATKGNHIEDEANAFAVKWTLSEKEEAEILMTELLDEDAVIGFAEKFGTHPAIIIGRLQHKGELDHREGRQFFVKLDWASTDC
ncbi:MAG: ImmA/IrrE family metallo-endopeptidase [Saprospiraceae bacterium]